MAKVTLIIVGGESKIDKLITGITGGAKSHVAISILGSTLEALGIKDENDIYPGVWLHSPLKHINHPDATFIGVDIPDVVSAEDTARRLIGTLYGYVDCVNGGIYNLTGIQLPGDGNLTANCSETVVRVLRAGGFDILPGVDADCITPGDIYKEVVA